jgi:hypothetical protein
LATLLVACNAVFGLNERPRRGGAAAGGGGEGGRAAPQCEAVCQEDVPSEWSGPLAVRTGTSPPACDTGTPELVVFDDVQGTAAQCECACGDAVGVNCDAASVTVTAYTDTTCTTVKRSDAQTVNGCFDLCCGGMFSAMYTKPEADTSAASCPPTTVTDTKDPPVWGQHLAGCGPIETFDCVGGHCFEMPGSDALCVYRNGEHTCPGPFSARAVWYANLDDTRGCEPCGCSAVDTSDCNEVIVAHHNDSCSANAGNFVAANTCFLPTPDIDSAKFESVAPTGSCTATGGVPLGAVTAAEPTTVCCVP